jgi:protein PhnA
MDIKDSNGAALEEGDSVQVIKDLKVKGRTKTLKRGKVFKNIRLTKKNEAIECREGKSVLVLKTCFLKKV